MLDAETLDQIFTRTVELGVTEDTLRELRASWPTVHFSQCLDDDVCGAEPVRSAPGLNLYLVDGRGHCLTMTQDLDAATGLVLAEVDDEDV